MKYLTAKQIEALSPVKLEVYEKRLARERERIRVDLVGFPNCIPIRFGLFGITAWVNNSRLQALSAACASQIQMYDMLKNDINNLNITFDIAIEEITNGEES